MYGLVNSAIQKMVTEQLGASVWKDICHQVGFEADAFESFGQYDDELTGKLVGKISEVTKTPAREILISFGHYWIEFAYQCEYSGILEVFGSGPESLLSSLDQLHTRLEMTFDNLQPPSFSTTRLNESELLVQYNSNRKLPLEPFVQGLIEGIYAHFKTPCEVTQVESVGSERAAFLVKAIRK